MTAKEKLINEMNALDDKDQYRRSKEVIGEYLLDMLTSDEVEEKVLAEGKTLEGTSKAMANYARKANSSCITDEDGFKVVRKYYGIGEKKSLTADVDSYFD